MDSGIPYALQDNNFCRLSQDKRRHSTDRQRQRVLPAVKVNPLPNKGPLLAATFAVPFPKPKDTYADMTEI